MNSSDVDGHPNLSLPGDNELHGLLSMDFGLKEWNEFDPKEIVRKYREFVYETGAVDAGKGKTMDKKIVEKARKKGYKQVIHVIQQLIQADAALRRSLIQAFCLI